MKKVLFFRHYRAIHGGHLKVFDYFGHVKHSPKHLPKIYFTANSVSNHPLRGEKNIVSSYDPTSADILFVSGRDWDELKDHPGIENRIPVINLIQHVRHAIPNDPRYQFLSRFAVRICVSPEVADAITATGCCNGPIHVIPNGIDFNLLPRPSEPSIDLFIGGLKRPELAEQLASRLRGKGLTIDCLTARIDRNDYLERMSRSQIAVLLPHETEGFYLPALEAMAIGRPLVCLDAVANRSFCIDHETCLIPRANVCSLEGAVLELINNRTLALELRSTALRRSKDFDLSREQSAFLAILNSL